MNPTAVRGAGGAHKVSEETWEKLISGSPELDVTCNSVIIEISGKGGHVDLTIVDLTGIIQSHQKGHSPTLI